jgi:hypothetical protein
MLNHMEFTKLSHLHLETLQKNSRLSHFSHNSHNCVSKLYKKYTTLTLFTKLSHFVFETLQKIQNSHTFYTTFTLFYTHYVLRKCSFTIVFYNLTRSDTQESNYGGYPLHLTKYSVLPAFLRVFKIFSIMNKSLVSVTIFCSSDS